MIRAAAIGAIALLLSTPALAQQQAVSGKGAVLRGLDKVNGQTVDVQLQNGGRAEVFGLTVDLADCRFPAENPTGDAFAFLTVLETGKSSVQFQGWMVASSPALNALDHSRYDVWVLRCVIS